MIKLRTNLKTIVSVMRILISNSTLQHKLIKENGKGFHGNIVVRNAHWASGITGQKSDYLVLQVKLFLFHGLPIFGNFARGTHGNFVMDFLHWKNRWGKI
jgi:hypothetical protein